MKNLLITLLMLLASSASGQTFERTYGGEGRDEGRVVIESMNGGYYACGLSSGDFPFLLKTDEFGIEEWMMTYDEGDYFSIIREVSSDRLIIGGSGNSRPILTMYNVEGEEVWDYDFGLEESSSVKDIEIDEVGNLVVLVSLYNNTDLVEEDDYIIFKINSLGELISEYLHTNLDYKESLSDILLLEDGDYLIAGTIIEEAWASPLYIAKLDANFDTVWTFTGNWTYWGDEHFNNNGHDFVIERENGSFFIAYSGYDIGLIDGYAYLKFVSLNSNGQLLWDTFPLINPDTWESPSGVGQQYYFRNIRKIDSESLILIGTSGYNDQANVGGKLSLIKVDIEGNIFWHKTFNNSQGQFTASYFAQSVETTSDSGFVAIGYGSIGNDWETRQAYIVKTDSTGTLIKNNLNGTITFDENENCLGEEEEIGLKNWLVTALAEGIVYYDLTDTSGFYELNVDNGNYDIFITPPNQYWNSCELFYNTGDIADYDTLSNNFHVQASIYCPEMRVDVSTPLVRRCFDANYYVSFSNQGTIPAENAFIEVTFDQHLEITESIPPWTSQNGQTLIFDLETVDVEEYGNILIKVTVGCEDDGVELGQNHCVEAYIYPDTICAPANPSWDGSDIIVDADCENDSIRFFIRNIGDGNMDNEHEFIIIEDHIILMQEPFQLPSGGEIEIPVPTEGIAYRLEAEQSEGHPIGNMPSINVEGCNTTGANDFLLGFWNQYPEDDVANFISIDCQSNIGSFDPNDKKSQPVGYGSDNLIAQNTDIEYLIRFQNTGTDTAFTVIIEDILVSALDITTVVPGVSSHPYEFDIDNGRKLIFTFNDILLVDSTTNEAASHGFVKFRVSQMPNNQILPWPTRIFNKAQIFFDYNAPITTNQTRLTVGRHFIENYVSSTFDVEEQEEKRVFVNPNPFSEETIFTVKRIENTPLEFMLFDTQGRRLRHEIYSENSFNFLRKGLAKGLYFYKIETEGKLLDVGKIVIN